MMYIVAIFDPGIEENKLYKVTANSELEAKLMALELAGWDISSGESCFFEINVVVSEAMKL